MRKKEKMSPQHKCQAHAAQVHLISSVGGGGGRTLGIIAGGGYYMCMHEHRVVAIDLLRSACGM